ncbi:MAG: hypothetical protein MR876_05145 [Treponema porcinum]|uniref:hypothetical protein n=1 Tax=Treponema porcinum TaxID=261392 RepID=UPI0023565511|nr:hypothetical protein [Treponema porcinum]MCI6815935.1 hypothetical protein [Treponema porcinum]
MKKTTKRILGALAILAAFAFISCQSDDGGNSDSDSPKVEQSGTTDEGGTGSDSSGTGTTDAEQPGTSDEGGTGSDSSNTDTPDVELPGTPGGTSNPNDIFAGKTFYDDNYKTKFEKLEFSDNGTMTLYYNDAYLNEQEEWSKSLEYSYSIGDNNSANFVTKAVYLNEKAYSYSEALELTNSFDENYFLENLKEAYDDEEFDFTTEEGLLDCIKYDLSKRGIFLGINIDYQTALNKYVEYEKNYLKEFLSSMFSSVLKLTYSKNEDETISFDIPDSATFMDILSLYNSPFDISEFSYDYFNIDIWSKTGGSFSLSAGDDKTISGRIYAVDNSKIYGVIESDVRYEPYTEKIEFPYTTEGTGENTKVKITYAENTYTLTHCEYDFKLYPAE